MTAGSGTPALRYLGHADVLRAAADVDPVVVVAEALRLHAAGATTLPDEAYLSWSGADGRAARSLALPGALWGDRARMGMKVINSSLANPGRGLPRAQGLTMLFDPETAVPTVVMEGAHLSALRTSAYTALSIDLLGPPRVRQLGVIGCGALGAAHVRMLAPRLPGTRLVLFDHLHGRGSDAAADLHGTWPSEVVVAESAEDAVRASDVVVTTTTTTTGYLRHAWLSPGALVAHVSLDDVCADVVRRCGLLVVDDWGLVSADDRRLLGRMIRAGELAGPPGEGSVHGDDVAPGIRSVDACLGDILTGRHPGRRSPEEIVLSNPFGLGILDVALAAAVADVADAHGLGQLLPR